MQIKLKYRAVWENCYYSKYGRETAFKYGEKTYCHHGEQRFVRSGKSSNPGNICPEWRRCKLLDQAIQTAQARQAK